MSLKLKNRERLKPKPLKSTTTYQLRIPYGLAKYAVKERHLVNKYHTNKYIKNVMAFIILKASAPYSIIRNYKSNIETLAALCDCEKQTMFARIHWLEKEQFLSIEGNDIRLKAWKAVGQLIYINVKHYKTVIYEPGKNQQPHLQLFTVEIEDNRNRQKFMVQKKMQQNQSLNSGIKSIMLQQGHELNKLSDFNYVYAWMLTKYQNSFKGEPALHQLLQQVRPDVNRGVTGMAYHWNCISKQTVSYVKKQIAANGYAVITKGERITSRQRVRNTDCHVIWNRRKLQTVLALVDDIKPLFSHPQTTAYAVK